MNKTNRRLGFVTFFSILTMILLCIALFFALTTGFGNGVPGMGVSGLSRVCKRMCAGIPFKLWPQITLLIILVLLFLFLATAGKWIDRASRKNQAALFIALSIFLIFSSCLLYSA